MNVRPLASRRILAINTASSVGTRVLQLTVLVWVNQYLLRHISAGEYALLPLVMSLLIFGELFRNIFAGALGRFIVEADARRDDAGVTRIVSSMLPALAGAAVFLGALTALTVWQLDRVLALEPDQLGNARLMLSLLMAGLCLDLLTAPFTQGLYVRQRFVVLNAIELGCEILRAAIVFSLLLGVYPSVVWLTVGSVAAGLVNIVLRVLLTRRWVPAIRWDRTQFCRQTARRLLGFGAWTSVQGLTNLIATSAPALILNRAASPVDVASFHLGRLPDLQLRRVATAAATPLQPMLTSLQAVRGEAALHELYYRGGRYHLWIILLAAVPLVLFADAIILLYAGENYAMAAAVLVPLLAVYPLAWASAMFYRIAHAIGRIGAYYVCDLVVQGVTLLALLYAVVVRGLGAPGAALAIAGTSGVLHVVLVWPMGLRLIRGRWSLFLRQTLLPGTVPAVAAAGACLLFRQAVPLDNWWRIGAGSLLAGLVYVAVLLAFCLAPPDRALLARVLTRFRGRSSVPPASELREAAP